MGMMPDHTPPAMSIQQASGHIEHWYARFKKKPSKKHYSTQKKIGIGIFSD